MVERMWDRFQVPEAYRRKDNIDYIVMDTPERGDNKPVGKLLKTIIRKR